MSTAAMQAPAGAGKALVGLSWVTELGNVCYRLRNQPHDSVRGIS